MNSFPSHVISCGWGGRRESPDAVGQRFLHTVQRLRQIDPIFAHWFAFTGPTTQVPLDETPAVIEKIIENFTREFNEDWEPGVGYMYGASTQIDEESPRYMGLFMHAGHGSNRLFFANNVNLNTHRSANLGHEMVAYAIWKSALLALAECFDVTEARAYPSNLQTDDSKENYLRPGWMTYISPRFAGLITPPPSVLTEYTPAGALFMAATDETFSIDNPAHLAGVRAIGEALAPLNALPLPFDDEPEPV